MNKFLGVVISSFLLFLIASCLGSQETNKTFPPTAAPGLLHVYNGTEVAFFNESGGYGFGSQSNSVFSLAGSTSTQMAQNSNLGFFYIGGSCASCNYLTFFNGYNGGFINTTDSLSRITMATNGKATGVAVNEVLGRVYVVDMVNETIAMTKDFTNQFTNLSLAGSSVDWSTEGTDIQYVASMDEIERIAITSPTDKKILFADKDGNKVTTASTDLSISSTNCTTVLYPVATDNQIFVLCNGATQASVVAFSGDGTPNYATNLLSTSTITVTGMSAGTDIFYDKTNNQIIVVGEKQVSSINPVSLAITQTKDLTSCSGTMTLSAVTSNGTTIFVADSTNSTIYKLNSSLDLTDGTCAGSSFTLSNATTPDRISYF